MKVSHIRKIFKIFITFYGFNLDVEVHDYIGKYKIETLNSNEYRTRCLKNQTFLVH